jgi:hypothetical protein
LPNALIPARLAARRRETGHNPLAPGVGMADIFSAFDVGARAARFDAARGSGGFLVAGCGAGSGILVNKDRALPPRSADQISGPRGPVNQGAVQWLLAP